MAKKKKFGLALEKLEEHMPPLKTGLLMDDDAVAKALAEHSAIEGQKLIMLLMHYGLEFGDYRGLSLALAREFLNGFKEATPMGRKVKWTNHILGILFVEIERKRIGVGLTGKKNTPEIYKAVASQAPWNSFLETVWGDGITSDPAEAIRKAYFKAKEKEWSNVVWKAYRWHEETGTVDEWEKLVLSEVKVPAQNEIT